jgi:leader peptidase (prepilin peptidase)/N-methyltransferase
VEGGESSLPKEIDQRIAASIPRERTSQLILFGLVAAASAASVVVAPGAQGLFGAGLAMLVVAIALEDRRSFTIPDHLSATAFALGLAYQMYMGPVWAEAIVQGLLRGVVCGLAFLVLRQSYYALRRRHGLGLGDVKLAVVAGVWLDWTAMPVAVELATMGAIISLIWARLWGNPLHLFQRIPFGLYFAPAIWICWLSSGFSFGPL